MTAQDAWTFLSRARLIRVIDGDTAVFDIERKFHDVRLGVHVRFLGVNCPEKNRAATKAAGYEAMYFTVLTLAGWNHPDVSWPFRITSPLRKGGDMFDSLGRYLADVSSSTQPDVTVSRLLLDAGHAVPYR